MKKLFLLALAPMIAFSTAEADAKNQKPEPDQLELCGAYMRVAPFCGESLLVDTRQLSAMQIISVPLSPERGEKWAKLHREKRRGISYIETNEKGEKVSTGRPVIPAVMRVIATPPAGTSGKTMLFQALVNPDMTSMSVLLPAGGNFIGWSAYILSSEGKHALTMSGELIKVGKVHRNDGNLSLDLSRLPTSQITNSLFVTRGDGSGAIEALEAAFVDHKLVRDRNGETRVYSGLYGTFTPISPDGTSVVAMYSNCRKAGQRLVEKGNLRIDSTALLSGAATGGLTLLPQVIQNLLALRNKSCR